MAVVLGWIEEDYPERIVDTELALRSGQPAANSTVDELYNLAAELLIDSGWDLEPTLTRFWLNIECPAGPTSPELEYAHMSFSHAYFDGIVPSIMFGSVSLDRSEGTASVQIDYEPLRWQNEPIDLGRIEVDWREAWEISQEAGGSAFLERMGGACLASLRFHDERWRVGYSGDGYPSSRESGLVIWVDAKTGEAEVTVRPTEPSR